MYLCIQLNISSVAVISPARIITFCVHQNIGNAGERAAVLPGHIINDSVHTKKLELLVREQLFYWVTSLLILYPPK